MRGVHFWGNIWQIFKIYDFGFDIFEKGRILGDFPGLATSKLIFFQKMEGQHMCIYSIVSPNWLEKSKMVRLVMCA